MTMQSSGSGSGRRAVPALLALLFLLAGWGAGAAELKALRSIIQPGEEAPGFSLKDIDGGSVAFKPASGKPSLIVFWSVFCPLCRELTPTINAIAKKHRKDVATIGINLDGKRFTNAVRQFLKENAFAFPVGLDDIRNDFFIASDPYGVEKTPTAVLVDGNGNVYKTFVAEEMRDLVKNFDREFAGLKMKGVARKKK
jgi:thiol-disulfide isomerase/thioredoxin